MRLIAAFNHAHIFIDPNPDAERSFAERERTFGMPRSSWRDYATALISKGGGIFHRSAKSIPVTPEMREVFDLVGESISGEEMMKSALSKRRMRPAVPWRLRRY